MDFQVRTAGAYLNDQFALSRYVNSTPGAIETLGKWGARLARTPDGTVVGVPAFWAPDYTLGFIDIDLMLPIRARARRLGTRILNKIHVVDLLVEQDRVVGAVGFDIAPRSLSYLQSQGHDTGERQLRLQGEEVLGGRHRRRHCRGISRRSRDA